MQESKFNKLCGLRQVASHERSNIRLETIVDHKITKIGVGLYFPL
jgi:hypothetical protein